jgi:hypothetical protein
MEHFHLAKVLHRQFFLGYHGLPLAVSNSPDVSRLEECCRRRCNPMRPLWPER